MRHEEQWDEVQPWILASEITRLLGDQKPTFPQVPKQNGSTQSTTVSKVEGFESLGISPWVLKAFQRSSARFQVAAENEVNKQMAQLDILPKTKSLSSQKRNILRDTITFLGTSMNLRRRFNRVHGIRH